MIDLRPRILAIDDTPANLLTLGMALAADFNLQTATSGEMGLTLALASPPDLIVLDVMMPEMDGFETCRRIKAEPALQDIPVVFVTAVNEIASEETGLALGAADYILKPINISVARQRIRNLLERERMRKEVEVQRDQLVAALAKQNLVEQALRDSFEKLHSILETTLDGYWQTDIHGNLRDVNPAYCQQSGYSREELLSMQIPELDAMDDEVFVAERIRYLVDYGREQFETQHRRKDGSIWPVEVSTTYRPTDGGQIFAFLRNIGERKQMEAQVHELAFYDPLTKLPNRRLLNDRLSQCLVAAKRTACYGALMFLDLDNFKPLNDTHGHEVGDLLLIEVASRLKGCIRAVDTVARFGGDEFVVVLGELDESKAASAAEAEIVARKILSTLSEPYVLAVKGAGMAEVTVEHRCTASIGVVLFNELDTSPDKVLNWADAAMYQAKEAGRNTIRFFGGNGC